MATLLFVYGTLKKGQPNHGLLAGQTFVRDVRTLPLYRLYGVADYPGMVLDRINGLKVRGELWRVDDETLAALDEFEGHPDLFARLDVAVQDEFKDVQAYLYQKPIPHGAVTGNVWPFPT